MADLLDITPTRAAQVVRINGTRIVAHGLNVKAVASIVARFPKIAGLLVGGGLGAADIASRFVRDFGDAIAPLIAAGCGHCDDEKYEQFANDQLALEDQVKLATAIIEATCPNGYGFFLEVIAKLTRQSEEAKIHKIRLKKSPSPSPPLSGPASHPIM
jgi:hypothetical protein